MDIEGATSLESLLSSPQPQGMELPPMDGQQQMAQQLPPMAPPMNTCTQEANPGSPAVVDTEPKDKKKKKYSKDEIQKLALYVLVAAVVVSLPMIQDKLYQYIPMLQGGGTGALIVNGAIVAAVFYAILHFA